MFNVERPPSHPESLLNIKIKAKLLTPSFTVTVFRYSQIGSAEYNEQVLENVLDTEGFKHEVPCPTCGKAASERHFDELLGGCINPVYSLDCSHCGHHECDKEYCSTCDTLNDLSEHRNERLLHCVMLFDHAKERVQAAQSVPGMLWTHLKHEIYHGQDIRLGLCHWLDLDTPTPTLMIKLLRQKLLDIRFKVRLDARIEQAKLNEA